ncbi:hypothetical protein BJ875DRAFT_511375 [Amylocarpus encephaloides]|uniref:FAD/NAD(P)-binding domain-containing protein n=1 Tax=Amylocarpus encephaloides TaxID=45428 RepID=A0A9P7YIR3_9HELO|nr:hypothetical protein BJ875DRAFT_511375 [Amylocarpus encephaloides]
MSSLFKGNKEAAGSFTVLEQAVLTRKTLRVVCVGAGYSGLTLAHKVQHECQLEDHINLTIYEKNADVGGTWFENTYPGVACDIPAHAYTFLFEPNPNWSKFYAPGPEIQAYIKRTAVKYELAKHIAFDSKVVETRWDQGSGKWKIKVEQDGIVKEDEAEILVNASGFLNGNGPRLKVSVNSRGSSCTAPNGKRIGVRTADGEEDFDIIVCATGFDTSFIPPWKLVGLNGAILEDRWKVNPDAFFSVQVDGMPNYFIFNGPNGVISHGSILAQVSWVCDYILRCAKKIATQDLKSITPKAQAVADFNVYSQEFLRRTVWADNCRSWYKNGKETGIVTGTYAGSILHFKDVLENIGDEHFDVVSNNKNVFKWLGNGQSLHDKDGTGDLAYYMKE